MLLNFQQFAIPQKYFLSDTFDSDLDDVNGVLKYGTVTLLCT